MISHLATRPGPILAAALALAPGLSAAQTAGSETPEAVPEVRVEASGQTATGRVQGFVATEQRSATKTETPFGEVNLSAGSHDRYQRLVQ